MSSIPKGGTTGSKLRSSWCYLSGRCGTSPDDPDDPDVVDDIRDFDVGTGQRADDLSGPGVRRWRHESSMRYVSRVASTDGIQPFETIVTPTDPDLKPTDADSIDFEYEITT